MRYPILIVFFFCFTTFLKAQNVQDTVYLMNGQSIGEKVIDTLMGSVSIANIKKPGKLIHFELSQLYMVRYANGKKRYYYGQDSSIYNYFTRDEMWMFMKGEVDARRGFRARGALLGAGIAGLVGGMTGTFWGPILPYGYMALSGITKVRIRHKTISNPVFVDSDAYILGYERVSRQRRRFTSIISGTIGLAVGYTIYGLFHQSYPETLKL